MQASHQQQQPLFTSEGPALYQDAFQHNRPFATAGPYDTPLHPSQEAAFAAWLRQNHVPFDPASRISDYDMRGYWLATGGAGWQPGQHFPDRFKTPYDTSFSSESQYASANNPFEWRGDTLVDGRTGAPVFRPGRHG
jgi:hypothetical protein